MGGKTKPSEGASEKQTAKATYTATLRECDEKGYYVLDSDAVEGMTVEQIREKWFTDLNWYPSSKGE